MRLKHGEFPQRLGTILLFIGMFLPSASFGQIIPCKKFVRGDVGAPELIRVAFDSFNASEMRVCGRDDIQFYSATLSPLRVGNICHIQEQRMTPIRGKLVVDGKPSEFQLIATGLCPTSLLPNYTASEETPETFLSLSNAWHKAFLPREFDRTFSAMQRSERESPDFRRLRKSALAGQTPRLSAISRLFDWGFLQGYRLRSDMMTGDQSYILEARIWFGRFVQIRGIGIEIA